jgi:hypothetical protein
MKLTASTPGSLFAPLSEAMWAPQRFSARKVIGASGMPETSSHAISPYVPSASVTVSPGPT